MGRKGSTETIAAVLIAFLESNVWSQAALGRRVGVERKTLVRILTDLSQGTMRLSREEDHPHVYWSVPKGWFPGAVAFRVEELRNLISVLRRAPRSQMRDALLQTIMNRATGVVDPDSEGTALVTQHLSAEEESRLSQLERAAESRAAIRARYYTRSRGDLAWRHLSVQRIVLDGMRFIAVCHRDRRLKWFRLDGVVSADLDPNEPFCAASPEAVERLLRESVDGYHSGMKPVSCAFHVQHREALWVRGQLPLACELEESEDETTFRVATAGMLPLARFLVGLGNAVRIDTPELATLVRELAEGALAQLPAVPARATDTTERMSGARKREAD